jgi:hypothetical protein
MIEVKGRRSSAHPTALAGFASSTKMPVDGVLRCNGKKVMQIPIAVRALCEFTAA